MFGFPGLSSANSVLLLGATGKAQECARAAFAAAGLRVLASSDVGRADLRPDIIAVLDCEECRRDWRQTAHEAQQAYPSAPLLLLTGRGSEADAIAALRMGLRDYLSLPVDTRTLSDALARCLETRGPSGPLNRHERGANKENMIGASRVLTAVRGHMWRAAAADCTVLITGETGTGKELAAEFIHVNSSRRDRPLVCVNCAALPDTLIESELFGHARGAFTGATEKSEGLISAADGGTVLLDEVGDMGPLAQAKILRVLEKKEVTAVGSTRARRVDVRFLAATNRDLTTMSRDGSFRKDLYYRLNVVRVDLPPLRERREDIPLLVEHFRRKLGRDAIGAISQDCLERLVAYDWPGNIRELRNVLESIFLSCEGGVVQSRDLPPELRPVQQGGGSLNDGERERLVEALCSSEWNKSRAAEQMHWSRMTLYRKMAKYRITRLSSPHS